MKSFFSISLFSAFLVIAASCKKDPKVNAPGNNGISSTSGTVTLQMTNVVGTRALVLNDSSYTNAHGDTFNVSVYKYFISNIQLLNADGSVYKENESYHLLDQANPASLSFQLHNVPFGNYTGIRFLIGVDSLRNVSGAQTGALDQSTGMFWDWNNGYIMTKLEGTSPQVPVSGNLFTFHIGGFSGPYNVLRTVQLSFNSTHADVEEHHSPTLVMKSDVAEWLQSPNTIDLSLIYFAQTGNKAALLADNYANMFSVVSIQ